jgi:hypothetical protein
VSAFARGGRRPAPRRAAGDRAAADETGSSRVPLAHLQRQAGNRAVAALLPRRALAVQRQAGWSDASAGGWNAGEKTVAGTAIRRVPIDGLKLGNQDEWRDDASQHLTDESAAGRAVVAIPSALDLTRPIDVLLHFHGYTETVDRPYAGWRQHREAGTVRDVALDQIEQQLHASGASQLIGVLPQGGVESQFGKLPIDGYIAEVLDRLVAVGALKSRPPAGRVIVSAHSGGGHLVRKTLEQEVAGKKTGQFGQLVLFEAINGKGELKTATKWVTTRLDADLAVLADPARTADQKAAYLATSPRLRAYYGNSAGYAKRYQALEASIEGWFTAHRAQLGAYADQLREHYQVIHSKGLRHEELIRGRKLRDKTNPGEGNITDAVRAFYGTAPAPAAAAGPDLAESLFALINAVGNVGGALLGAAATGFQDENEVTDLLFAVRHPELSGGRIPAGATALQKEWIAIRRDVVRPALRAVKAAATAPATRATPATPTAPAAPAVRLPAAPSAMSDKQRAEFVKKAIEQGTVASGATAKQKKKSQSAIDAMAKDFEKVQIPAEKWFEGIKPDATFLGVPIKPSGASASPGVHTELADVFARAEQTLLSRYPGKTPREVAKTLGVYEIVGLRRPKNATGGTMPSMHCYGLAVDINYAGNPFVGRKGGNPAVEATKRATLLLSGSEYTLNALPAGLAGGNAKRSTQMWDHLHGASEALKAYLNLSDAELAQRVAANGHGHDLAWWTAQLAEDRKLSSNSEFKGHTKPETGGFMDLSRELVEVLSGAGLTWGGAYRKGKDIMHFDLRTGTIRNR